MIWPRSELPHDYAETLIAIEGRIQRYVVIELKAVLFDPACVGRINVYLSAAAGFLLDGLPRTIPQADRLQQSLAKSGLRLEHVLVLDVADSAILERITGRRSDPITGHISHLRFAPPPTHIVDRLVHRPDDTEAVLGKRLREYHDKTAPLVL